MLNFLSALAAFFVGLMLWLMPLVVLPAVMLARRAFLMSQLGNRDDPYIERSASAWAVAAMIVVTALMLLVLELFPGFARWVVLR